MPEDDERVWQFGSMHEGSNQDFELTAVTGAELQESSHEAELLVLVAGWADRTEQLLIQMDLRVALELLAFLQACQRASGAAPIAPPAPTRTPD